MRLKKLIGITTMALSVMFLLPVRLNAEPHGGRRNQRRYKFVDVGTFGGPQSYINAAFALGAPNQINRHGTAVGGAATTIPISPDSNLSFCGGDSGLVPFVTHAFKWEDGATTDLGALPGPDNCAVATSINSKGDVVGQSENGRVDPLTGVRQARAVLWKDGKVRSLGAFGGNHSIAGNINNHGQVAGFALNTIPDPFSIYDLFILGSSNGTQTRAFLWQNGHKQDLGTLGGPDAAAGFVNERGQVIGNSYTNSMPNPTTGIPTIDPFLWENGRMIDLGTLGGTIGGPSGLNNRGQVIGGSNLEGDQDSHPFFWENGKLIDLYTDTVGGNPYHANAINDAGEIVGAGAFTDHPFDAYILRNGVATDLGTLSDDCYSEAFALNSMGQVVGNSVSCDFSVGRAFVWQNGMMFDLQELIPANSTLRLVTALVINDRGEIGGIGTPADCEFQEVCGHAFVLIPCDGDRANDVDCQQGENTAATVPSDTVSISQNPTREVVGLSLSPREIAARIESRFGRSRGLGTWKRK